MWLGAQLRFVWQEWRLIWVWWSLVIRMMGLAYQVPTGHNRERKSSIFYPVSCNAQNCPYAIQCCEYHTFPKCTKSNGNRKHHNYLHPHFTSTLAVMSIGGYWVFETFFASIKFLCTGLYGRHRQVLPLGCKCKRQQVYIIFYVYIMAWANFVS